VTRWRPASTERGGEEERTKKFGPFDASFDQLLGGTDRIRSRL
jgi:hypothetical protein